VSAGSQVTQFVSYYGYAGIAVIIALENLGVPVPGETALLAAGAAAAAGDLALPWVIAAGALAAIIGDNAGFAVGRWGGRRAILRFGPRIGLDETTYERASAFFAKWGGPGIVIARFLAFIRVVAALVLGSSGMPWRRFIPWQVAGAVIWSTVIASLGYAGFASLSMLLPRIERNLSVWWPVWALAVAGAAFGVWALIARRSRRRDTERAT